MALSKTTGAGAVVVGVLGGLTTVIVALTQPNVSACVATVLSAFGSHGEAIGIGAAGLLAGVAPIVAWFAHPPVPLTQKQQTEDYIQHGVTK